MVNYSYLATNLNNDHLFAHLKNNLIKIESKDSIYETNTYKRLLLKPLRNLTSFGF